MKGILNLYRPTDWARRAERSAKQSPTTESYRTQARRDFARVIHSSAFRRLQGKTQLFPNHENDYFRNRLTHSLEVAQVAKSIAIKINASDGYFTEYPIDTDIVELAALCHDLGHPPFGHNGEYALNECMSGYGGFEGNAQTLRILARLEKKETIHEGPPSPVSADGKDLRAGLNLTARALASVLKYDHRISSNSKSATPIKGYYASEETIVRFLKKSVCGKSSIQKFKTVECSIMDIADDIAYSTYDLEDAFKAGFLTPLKMRAAASDIVKRIADDVTKQVGKHFPELSSTERNVSQEDVAKTIVSIFKNMFGGGRAVSKILTVNASGAAEAIAALAAAVFQASELMSSAGYARTQLTSELVGSFIDGVRWEVNPSCPALSSVWLDIETLKKVEILKRFAYSTLIDSSMLKVAEYRGRTIVTDLFEALASKEGSKLMPDDFRSMYAS